MNGIADGCQSAGGGANETNSTAIVAKTPQAASTPPIGRDSGTSVFKASVNREYAMPIEKVAKAIGSRSRPETAASRPNNAAAE